MNTFKFPAKSTCPICQCNADADAVLVAIKGTEDDGVVEAYPFHVSCLLEDMVWVEKDNIVYKKWRLNK